MLTTLDHLEQQYSGLKKVKILREEVRVFFIIFVVVAGIVTLGVNWQLFANSFTDVFATQKDGVSHQQNIYQSEQSIVLSNSENKNLQVQKLEHILAIQPSTMQVEEGRENTLDTYLHEKLSSYTMKFNTLPPVNRLIIFKTDQNIPLVTPSFEKPVNEITQDDFEEQLYHGVVKYPTTTPPGKPGNTLIFGHTSYESWKYNKYGTVFRSLVKLEDNDKIKIIWEGNVYEYIFHYKDIISPSEINDFYLQYHTKNQDIVTLMGCYPFGSDKNRMVIVLKRL